MIFNPKPGLRVQVRYNPTLRRIMPHHGKTGTVTIGPPPPGRGPRNCIVKLDDGITIGLPIGNLFHVEPQT